ncbi:unnamed protein product [Effrenium voratum]|uniref:CUB domain-containing protein n=1 Tax=Effrenium voratum TaxID=2562239 RepID=A0AA36JLP3_9DINO|nr:unnamed protein product [Effrenium voratum]
MGADHSPAVGGPYSQLTPSTLPNADLAAQACHQAPQLELVVAGVSNRVQKLERSRGQISKDLADMLAETKHLQQLAGCEENTKAQQLTVGRAYDTESIQDTIASLGPGRRGSRCKTVPADQLPQVPEGRDEGQPVLQKSYTERLLAPPGLSLPVSENLLVKQKEINGVSASRVEWRIDSIKAKFKDCLVRPLVSPQFEAGGLPELRLLVFPNLGDLDGLTMREQKSRYEVRFAEGPLSGAIKFKVVTDTGDRLDIKFNLFIGDVIQAFEFCDNQDPGLRSHVLTERARGECTTGSPAQIQEIRVEQTSECSDVIGWADSEGYTCAEYANQSWCTSDGNKGPGWDSGWFDIEDLWNDGYSAQAACCSCGGGQVEHVSGMWEVMRGPCTVQDGCLLSPNYPADYSVNQSCTFIVNSTIAKPIMVLDWDVEYWNDYVSINGKLFSGNLRPDGEVPNGSIHWVSDDNITGRGWKLCPNLTRAAEVSNISSWSSAAASSSLEPNLTSFSTSSSSITTSSIFDAGSTTPQPQWTTTTAHCRDVVDWTDSTAFTCSDYANNQWCSPAGQGQTSWDNAWGSLDDYWNNGYTAESACCACGGGQAASISGPWMILSGPCIMQDGCIQSPGYPSNYSDNEHCTIEVNTTLARPVRVVDFQTEYKYDLLTVNGQQFSGRRQPAGIVPHTSMSWESDGDTTMRGWKLCMGDFPSGPEMFSVDGPCPLDSQGCVTSPNFPEKYGPMEDCIIQVFNPENKSIVVDQFSTEMHFDALWVNGRVYTGKLSPHGLVPREPIQWITDEDTADTGWRICPGPIGQQVADVGGFDAGSDQDNEYAYGGYGFDGAADGDRDGDAEERDGDELSQSQAPAFQGAEDANSASSFGSFGVKVLVAVVTAGLAVVLCIRYKRGNEKRGDGRGMSYGSTPWRPSRLEVRAL